MKCRFLVVEGLDGVGKSTLVRNLAVALGGRADDTPGPDIRPIRGRVLDALQDPVARCLLYAATVVERGSRAAAARQAGETVVMDRYWVSTIAYARARGVELDLSGVVLAVPAPDVTIWLTMDESVRQARLADRGMTVADRETLDPTFRDSVLSVARSLDGPAGVDLFIDVTHCDEVEAVEVVLRALRGESRG